MTFPKVSISLLQHLDPPPSQKNPTNRFSSISMQSAGEERGRVCPSPSFYSEVRQHHCIQWHLLFGIIVGNESLKKWCKRRRKLVITWPALFLMTKFRKKICREFDVNRIIRWMLRTKEEVEVIREDNVTLDQRDQTPRASSTLGE